MSDIGISNEVRVERVDYSSETEMVGTAIATSPVPVPENTRDGSHVKVGLQIET